MKQNNTTTIVKTIHELSLRVSRSLSKSLEAIRELPLRIARNGMLFALGFFGTTILAVAISGTIKTWTTGEVLKSADLNTTIASLKTAIEGIPNWTKAANGNDAYYTAGNVGIGTASPTSRLDLDGGELRIRSGNTQITYFGQDGSKGYIEHKGNNSTNEDFTVQSSKSGDSINYSFFKIDPSSGFSFSSSGSGNGNVGIGTTSPIHPLSVSSAANTVPIGIRNSATGNLVMGVTSNGTPGDALIDLFSNSSTTSAQIVRINTNGNSFFNGGNVGIGTASPSATLHVVGTTLATAWSTSDERYKKNIQTLQSPLEKILKLRGVNYEWRKDEFKEMKFKSGKDIGFIGQEVEKVLPEVIFKDEKGYISLAYSHILPVVVEAFKELKKDHDLVKAEKAANDKKLHALEEDNKRLRDTVETMRATSLQSTITSQRVQQLEDRLRAIENTQMARK